MSDGSVENLGRIIKEQRIRVPLTLRELADMSGTSPSHLGRIERGERNPSAHVLRKIAKPLGFDEDELLTLAGFRSSPAPAIAESSPGYSSSRLDPSVARMLAEEPVDVQRAVIHILNTLKIIAKGIAKESH